MPLQPVALPAFRDNYLWLLACDGQALVVDPGDAVPVTAWLEREGLRLAFILVTHHHPDHTAGIAALKAAHRPLVLGPDEGIAGIDRIVAGGDALDLSPFGRARVIAVPGHTRGHVAFHFAADHLLFCGDTLFSGGCGRLFEGTAAQLHASLQALAALPDATRICCAHEYTEANLRFAAAVEPENVALAQRTREVEALRRQGRPSLPVTLGQERDYNPFLRSGIPAVVDAASVQAGHALAPGADTLAALRAWKDVF
jgi:hydroxyacylglutathione hydrolase